MRISLKFIIFSCLFWSNIPLIHASNIPRLSQLINEFRASPLAATEILRPQGSMSCDEYICEQVSSYHCRSQHNNRTIIAHCSQNQDSLCLEQAQQHLNHHALDELNEWKTLAQYCSGIYSPHCIETFTNYLVKSDYDEFDEYARVLRGCSGNKNGLCLQYVCDHLPKSDCDQLGEISYIASLCATESWCQGVYCLRKK